MQRRSCPDTFRPPSDEYSTIFPAHWPDSVLGQFGIQTPPKTEQSSLMAGLECSLGEAPRALYFEWVCEIDVQGYLNEVYRASWRSAEDHQAWLTNSVVAVNLDPNGILKAGRWDVGRHLSHKLERLYGYGSMRKFPPRLLHTKSS